MIKVRDLQNELIKEGVELIAGEGGLDKIVEHLSVQEFSFKSSRVHKNTSILTTFYGFKDIKEIIEHFEWYLHIGISGVFVHNAIYSSVPKELIHFAEQAKIPLFSVPSTTPYHVIYEKYDELIYREKTKLKDEIDKLNQSMLDALLLEKDIHFIIQSIGKYLNQPIIYLNKEREIISLWNTSYFSRLDLRDWLDELFRKCLETFEKVRVKLKPIEMEFDSEIKLNSILILPLNSKLDFYGYLIIGHNSNEAPFHEIIIKNAVTALVLEAMKKNQTNEYHKNKDIKLMEEIIFDKRDAEVSIDDFYNNVRNIKSLLIAEPEDKKNLKKFYQFIQKELDEVDSSGLVWIMDNKIVSVLQKEPLEIIRLLSNGNKVRIGLSGRLGEFSKKGIKTLYEQAYISLHYAHVQKKSLCIWNELGSEKITYFMNNSYLLKDYHLDYLQPIIDYDKENDTNLIKTLDIFLKTFFSLKESGEQLHLHPNTVKYRINKIQGIIDMKIDEPNQYMNLMIALKSYYYNIDLSNYTSN